MSKVSDFLLWPSWAARVVDRHSTVDLHARVSMAQIMRVVMGDPSSDACSSHRSS